MNKIEFFNFGRSAFKSGLLSYNLNTNKKILIPEYICLEITNSLDELSIPYEFYPVFDNLKPNWGFLENIDKSNCSAILMVHYFGIPQDIPTFIKFSIKNNLYLIEDNAHGYGGKFKNKDLGTFGDFGISSPRKILNLKFGGILYKNTRPLKKKIYKKNNIEIIISIIFFITEKLIFLKKIIKKYIRKRPLYEDPIHFRESKKDIRLLDFFSQMQTTRINFDSIIKIRRGIFNDWKKFSILNDLEPIFLSLGDDIVPWCFPVNVPSKKIRIELLDWAWENQLNVFTWPSLPLKIIKDNTNGYKIWKNVICFSTDPVNKHVKSFLCTRCIN